MSSFFASIAWWYLIFKCWYLNVYSLLVTLVCFFCGASVVLCYLFWFYSISFWYPVVFLQGKDKTPEERRIAICIFDDVAEQCRESALKYYDTYLPFLLEAANDENSDVRQVCFLFCHVPLIHLPFLLGQNWYNAESFLHLGCCLWCGCMCWVWWTCFSPTSWRYVMFLVFTLFNIVLVIVQPIQQCDVSDVRGPIKIKQCYKTSWGTASWQYHGIWQCCFGAWKNMPISSGWYWCSSGIGSILNFWWYD